MISCSPDVKMMSAHLPHCKSVPFFTGKLITSGSGSNRVSLAGPYIGAPLAVMMLESLIARGAQKIVVIGWCGAVNQSLHIGDLLVADTALVEEGTSGSYQHLNPSQPTSCSDLDLSNGVARFLEQHSFDYTRATIWTTDAPYRETVDKVTFYRQQGALAVEMECSALFSAASYRNIPIAALLMVSDSVAAPTWQPGI